MSLNKIPSDIDLINCEKHYNKLKLTKKSKNKNVENEIPKYSDYAMIPNSSYNVQQLKLIAKNYKLKISGNKQELLLRIFSFLYLSYFTNKIQSLYRGHLQRRYNKCHGPAYLDKTLCTNSTDFLTMDPLDELTNEQFFSYKDDDGFIYGFDILSLYNLIKKNEIVQNPYNRRDLSKIVLTNFKTLIRLSKILKYEILIDIKDNSSELSEKKQLDLRIVTLFQNIDSLGNYSNPNWFMNLNRSQLLKLLKELLDIWVYRAPLTKETKRAICPPIGNPFRFINVLQLSQIDNIEEIKKNIISILEIFVNSGIDKDSKCLGAYYVLGALTLVSQEAASALPWLYQAVTYI